MKYTLLLIAAVAVLGTPRVHGAAKLPAGIDRCKRNDPKLNECLQDAIQKAVPQIAKGITSLGVNALDPVEATYIEIGQGSGSININLKFHNVKIHGLRNVVISSVRENLDKYELQFEGLAPFLTLDADYEMDGKFLVLPVTGKGRCNLTATDLKAKLDLKGGSKKKDGQDFFDVKEFILKLDRPALITVNFENLFNGDKTLGDSMNSLMNENWKELWDGLLSDPLNTAFSQVFKGMTTSIFSKVPYDDIFLK